MRNKTPILFIVLFVFTIAFSAAAQVMQFFRISGPAATTIKAFNPDGTLVWSNAQPGTNYTVQTVPSLPGGTNWVDYVQLPVINGANTNQIIDLNPPAGMALIPAGLFKMGDTLDGNSNAKPTNVMVSAFYMDVNLVNYYQWQSLYNWATNAGYSFVHSGSSGSATNQPVTSVDWYDCVKWCNARSQQEDLMPVYYTDAGFTLLYTNGELTLYANWTNNGYRLPTEAEWEKAARGGLSGQRFPWGDTISESKANYRSVGASYDFGPPGYNSIGQTNLTPVGTFTANGYGLYDMAGNVFEWCWDWYGSAYAGGFDPLGPVTGDQRTIRGGSWIYTANEARCAYRYLGFPASVPNVATADRGFRCVRRF